MRLGYDEIANHPRLAPCIREQATALLTIQQASPRTASIFATQQRWLMAHSALALCFRSLEAGASGMPAAQFIKAAVTHHIASRNTADAFLKEMHHYGYLEVGPSAGDRRARPLALTPTSRAAIAGWLAVHLKALDGFDGGDRYVAFMEAPQSIGRIQPIIADGLVGSVPIRNPDAAFSLFTWLNEGGIVMDWLYVGLAAEQLEREHVPSTVASFDDIGERILLSRTHLTRKLRMAEAMGSLGWMGARGKSTMWVSGDFVRQYHDQQAAKLAIIDGAFHTVFNLRADPTHPNKSQAARLGEIVNSQ